jgi:hypothetical protein
MRTKMQNTTEGGYAHLARPDPRILWGGTRLAARAMVSHVAGGWASVVVSPAAGHPDSLCLRMRPSQRRLSLDQHLPRAFSLLTPHAVVPSAPHGASTPMICPPGRGHAWCPTWSGREEWSTRWNSIYFCSILILLCRTHRGEWCCERKSRDVMNLCSLYSFIPFFYICEATLKRWNGVRTRRFSGGCAWRCFGASVAGTWSSSSEYFCTVTLPFKCLNFT